MIKILALTLAVIMAVVPIVVVIDVDDNIVYVDVHGEVFSFYGEGFFVNEKIRVVFINDMILEVLP